MLGTTTPRVVVSLRVDDPRVRDELMTLRDVSRALDVSSVEAAMMFVPPFRGAQAFLGVRDGEGRLLGYARLALPGDVAGAPAYLSLVVDPAARRQQVATALLTRAPHTARAHGATHLLAESRDSPSARRLAARRGFVAAGRERRSRLRLADWDRPPRGLEEATHESFRDTDYLPVSWRDRCPSALLDGYALALTAMHDEPPISAQEIRYQEEAQHASGVRCYTVALVRRACGTLAAVSSLRLRAGEDIAEQCETVVLPAYRGRGLGRGVKETLLETVRRAEPGLRWIDTHNAHDNAAILALNTRLGFVPVDDRVVWARSL